MIFKYFSFLNELYQADLISTLEGCSNDEIEQFTMIANCPIPKAYHEFLTIAGKSNPWMTASAGNFYCGIEYMIAEYKTVVNGYIEMGWSDLKVQENIIPISFHDGSFNYIPSDEGENPPVYSVCEPSHARHFIHSHTLVDFIVKLCEESLFYDTPIKNSLFSRSSKTAPSVRSILHGYKIDYDRYNYITEFIIE